MTLQQQWQQDVDRFGDGVHLMYMVSENGRWCNLVGNMPRGIKERPNLFRRKQSAALPFDLERAKAGDVVELFIDDNWREFCCSFENAVINDSHIFMNLEIAKISQDDGWIFKESIHNLRMKYPPTRKQEQ